MYHIPKDKRAYQSADKIYEGLKKCTKRKNLDELTISDICKTSGVSRATFYRLFDNILDILQWKCEQNLLDIMNVAKEQKDKKDFYKIVHQFISYWIEDKELVYILMKFSKMDILYALHLKHMDTLLEVSFITTALSEKQKFYLSSVLAGLFPSLITVLYNYKDESASAIYISMCKTLEILNQLFICEDKK